jgi:hypothetical protein
MRNLLYSLGLVALVYVLASVLSGSWLAGAIPGLIAGSVLYFVLARRSFKQFETLATGAMATLQGAQQDPSRVDAAKTLLLDGLALGKDQFLIAEQIHGQVGQLAYMQGRNIEAREHLSQAWSRDWMSMTVLSALDHREGKSTDALARMEKAKAGGSGQALYWGVRAWIAKDSGDSRLALALLAEGLEQNKSSAPLTTWRDALANAKDLDLMAFGAQWFQFFPDHAQRLRPDQQMRLMQEMGQTPPTRPAANLPPEPQPNRAARRAKGKTEPGPQLPHPRR